MGDSVRIGGPGFGCNGEFEWMTWSESRATCPGREARAVFGVKKRMLLMVRAVSFILMCEVSRLVDLKMGNVRCS
jgi:hypothetical protein